MRTRWRRRLIAIAAAHGGGSTASGGAVQIAVACQSRHRPPCALASDTPNPDGVPLLRGRSVLAPSARPSLKNHGDLQTSGPRGCVGFTENLAVWEASRILALREESLEPRGCGARITGGCRAGPHAPGAWNHGRGLTGGAFSVEDLRESARPSITHLFRRAAFAIIEGRNTA